MLPLNCRYKQYRTFIHIHRAVCRCADIKKKKKSGEGGKKKKQDMSTGKAENKRGTQSQHAFGCEPRRRAAEHHPSTPNPYCQWLGPNEVKICSAWWLEAKALYCCCAAFVCWVHSPLWPEVSIQPPWLRAARLHRLKRSNPKIVQLSISFIQALQRTSRPLKPR